MKRVREVFETVIIDKAKLEIYKVHIDGPCLSLNRNYVKKFKEGDLVRVSVERLPKKRAGAK